MSTKPMQKPYLSPIARLYVLACCVALTLVASPQHGVSADAEGIHRFAWDSCLDTAKGNPAARFGIYAYRSLAVFHPEIYLRSDELVSEALEDLPGSRLTYRSRDARDVELFLRIARRETKGGAFGWGMMTVIPDSIYDLKPPKSATDWMDLRAPSVAVLLKSHTGRLSTLESALLRYSQLDRTGQAPENLFVVVDSKGAGHLATDSAVWTAGLSNREVKKTKDIKPMLVFNRDAVFSVMTGRDDRVHSPSLMHLMDRLGTPAKLSMDSESRDRAARIAETSRLSDSTEHKLAALLASGLADLKQPYIANAWSELVPAVSPRQSCATMLLQETFFWANRLSPTAALLAGEFEDQTLGDAVERVEAEYLMRAGLRAADDSSETSVEAWGCLWSYDLLLTSIDDNILARAGSSLSQAGAISAVLDLAGVEHFQLSVRTGDKQIPDQEWVFAGNGKYQFNFGVWTALPDSIDMARRATSILTAGFSLRGASMRIGENLFCSSMDDLEVSEHLTRIARLLPSAALSVVSPNGQLIPLQKFLADLADEQLQSSRMSWPVSSTE